MIIDEMCGNRPLLGPVVHGVRRGRDQRMAGE